MINHPQSLHENSSNVLTLDKLVEILEAHQGFFVVEDVEYDSMLYCGTDNLYFSYCFNYHIGKAVLETLLIVDNAIKHSDSYYTVISQGKRYSLLLKG